MWSLLAGDHNSLLPPSYLSMTYQQTHTHTHIISYIHTHSLTSNHIHSPSDLMSSPIMPTHPIYHTFRSINTPHNHRFTHSHTSFHSIEVSKRLRVQSYLQRKVKQGMIYPLIYLHTPSNTVSQNISSNTFLNTNPFHMYSHTYQFNNYCHPEETKIKRRRRD